MTKAEVSKHLSQLLLCKEADNFCSPSLCSGFPRTLNTFKRRKNSWLYDNEFTTLPPDVFAQLTQLLDL